MNTKTATLIAVIGAAITLILQILIQFSTDFYRTNYDTIGYFFLLSSACYLVFFINLYSKQSGK